MLEVVFAFGKVELEIFTLKEKLLKKEHKSYNPNIRKAAAQKMNQGYPELCDFCSPDKVGQLELSV